MIIRPRPRFSTIKWESCDEDKRWGYRQKKDARSVSEFDFRALLSTDRSALMRRHTACIFKWKLAVAGKVIVFSSILNVCSVGGQERPFPLPNGKSMPGVSSLKVDVGLVVVHATVVDPNYRFVTGLEKENFEVYEDKIPQTISQFGVEDAAALIGLLFDVSGSMSDTIGKARDAAVSFFKTNNQEDEYFLMTFSDRPVVDREFTSDINAIQNELALKDAKGCTTLYDAVYLALEKMRQSHNPKRAILLITDGEDTYSRYSMVNVCNAIKESDVQIYAIGIFNYNSAAARRDDIGKTVLREMAEVSGGEAFFPYSIDELGDINKKIAMELRSQYVLGYAPTNSTRDGRWRKLRIKLHPPKGLPRLSVRARTGYYAPAVAESAN
jgi:Ca-activated chloride channel family protein